VAESFWKCSKSDRKCSRSVRKESKSVRKLDSITLDTWQRSLEAIKLEVDILVKSNPYWHGLKHTEVKIMVIMSKLLEYCVLTTKIHHHFINLYKKVNFEGLFVHLCHSIP